VCLCILIFCVLGDLTINSAQHACRSVKVSNPTARDIAVSWETYVTTASDTQLVDLLFSEFEDGVSLRIRIHEGQRCDDGPFMTLSPSMVVPANRDASVSIAFQSPTAGDFQGFLLGTLALPPGTSPSTNPTTLKLLLAGQAVDPVLQCKMESDDGILAFTSPAQGLGGMLYATVLLRNRSPAVLSVSPVCPAPYLTYDENSATYTRSAPLFTIAPGGSHPLKVACKIDKVAISDALRVLPGPLTLEVPLHAMDDSIHTDLLSNKANLELLFANGKVQSIPLRTTIQLPSLVVQPESLSFGTVVLGSKASQSLALSNRGLSATNWSATILPIDDNVDVSAFSISVSSGFLEDYSSRSNKYTTTIQVRLLRDF
jgi:hypothetical protein